MKLLRGAFALCVFTIGGCMPVVQHGPWVRDGTSGGFSFGVGRQDYLDAEVDAGWGIGLDGSIRQGIAVDDTSFTGVAFGLQLPLVAVFALAEEIDNPVELLGLASGDVYVTGSRRWPHAMSVGLQASRYHWMPYAQFGSKTPLKGGWYTTQALLFVEDSDFYMWLPSITRVEANSETNAAHITLTGGIGKDGSDTAYMAMLTVVLEFSRRRRQRED